MNNININHINNTNNVIGIANIRAHTSGHIAELLTACVMDNPQERFESAHVDQHPQSMIASNAQQAL